MVNQRHHMWRLLVPVSNCSCRDAGAVIDLALTPGGSHLAAALHDHSGQHNHLQIWQAESAPLQVQYILEACVSLSDTPTAVAWLLSCAVTPTLAVTCHGSVQIFAQSQARGWTVITKLGNMGQPIRALQVDSEGSLMVTAGNQLASGSNLVQAHTSSSSSATGSSQLLQIPLAQLVLELAGPLPDYAPAALAMLIVKGRTKTARDVLLSLLSWLKLHDPSVHVNPPERTANSSCFQQLLPDASLDVLLDRPSLGALFSLIDTLPLSHPPEQPANGGSSLSVLQQQPRTEKISAMDHSHTSKQELKRLPQSMPVSADPFAFNAGAFGMGNTADEEQEEQEAPSVQPAAGADPFAFNAGAFGMSQEQEEEAAQPPSAQAAKDPFAFDAGTFGFADEGNTEQPQHPAPKPAAASIDPYAFDTGAFGMTNLQPAEENGDAEPSAAKPAGAPPDPFAFDPGAFGFSGEEMPQQPIQTSPSVAASASATASAAAADPFAFNPDAFGFSSNLSDKEDQTQPEVVPVEQAEASAVDPYAFDAGAFGMGSTPESSQRSGEGTTKSQAPTQTGADPFAFDPGAFGMGASTTPPHQSVTTLPQRSVNFSKPAAKFRAATLPVSKPQVPALQTKAAAIPKAQQQQPAITIYRPKKGSNSSKQTAVLSSSDLASLQKLLGTALSQADNTSPKEDSSSPCSPTGLAKGLTSALPPGLTPELTHALLNIAHILCDDPPKSLPPSSQQGGAVESAAAARMISQPVDWPALDEAAQKAVRAIQLAACHLQAATGEAHRHTGMY